MIRSLLLRIKKFSLPLFLSAIVVKYYWQIDDLYVGSFLGLEAAGLYWFAFYYPHFILKLQSPFLRIILPLYAKLSLKKMIQIYALLTKGTALLVIYPCLLVIFFSHEIIRLIFGTQWLEATLAFQIYITLIGLRATMIYWTDIFIVKNQTSFQMKISILNAVLLTLLMIVFMYFLEGSIVTMSWIVLATIAVSMVPMALKVKKMLNINYGDILRLPLLVLLGSCIILFGGEQIGLQKAFVSVIGLIAYALTIFMFAYKDFAKFHKIIRGI